MPAELADAIDELAATSPVPVKHVVMDANVGLGPALDAGLAACSHEIVARMDADDVSLPDRFAEQLPVVEARRRHRRVGPARVRQLGGRHRRPPYAAHRPRRDPPGDPLPRPVQPPDGGLPPLGRPGRRRLQRHGADGGLPAVHPDGRGRSPAGQPRRAAGLLPRRRRRLRAAGRPPAAPLRARPAAAVPGPGHHHPRPVRPQRGRPRRLPAGAGGPAPHRVPRPDRQPRGRRDRQCPADRLSCHPSQELCVER